MKKLTWNKHTAGAWMQQQKRVKMNSKERKKSQTKLRRNLKIDHDFTNS